MLNYCIQRKRDRYEHSSKPVNIAAVLRETGDSIYSKQKLPGSPNELNWDVETLNSESDDEFFEAVEEQERSLQSLANEEMGTTSPRGSIAGNQSPVESPSGSLMNLDKSATEVEFERTGVLKETDMLLLETNEPLCIPVTQVYLLILTSLLIVML